MRTPNIAFENLRAEMQRGNVTVLDIAGCWGVSRDIAARKLSRRSRVNLDEALSAQRTFFPDKSIRYLFAEVSNSDAAIKKRQ